MGDGLLLVYHGWQRGRRCRVKESRQSSGEAWRLRGLRNGSKWVEQITAMHGGYVLYACLGRRRSRCTAHGEQHEQRGRATVSNCSLGSYDCTIKSGVLSLELSGDLEMRSPSRNEPRPVNVTRAAAFVYASSVVGHLSTTPTPQHHASASRNHGRRTVAPLPRPARHGHSTSTTGISPRALMRPGLERRCLMLWRGHMQRRHGLLWRKMRQ